MKEKNKLLSEKYDYYKSMKQISDKMANKIFAENNEMLKMKLYELILNICNQEVYDYTYIFTTQDLYFIAEYNINIENIIMSCRNDVLRVRLRE